MVKRGEFPHKFSVTKSSIPSFSGSHPISQGVPHLFRHRQSHSHVWYKQARGYSLSKSVKSSNRIMELCPKQMLNPRIFRGVVARLGQPDIDLFASRVNHQIPEFVSWRPEPTAVATDAFNLTWNYHLSYLFPAFSLILLCLKKIQRDQAECILIAPVWKSRPWYPILLSMLSYQPLLLPQSWFLLKLPGTNEIHTFCTWRSFRLAAWKVSGKDFKIKDFLKRCPKFSSPHGEKALQGNMSVLGDHGVAGVTLGRLIIFQHLSKISWRTWHTFSMRKVFSIAQSMFTGRQSLHSTNP